MPRLWDDTIEAHRSAVRDATLETTADLVAKHGLRGVTMSQIAEQTGIGRATLYKYFPDVEAILGAWHERQVKAHLEQLATARDQATGAAGRLRAVLETYAVIAHGARGRNDSELAALLHGRPQVRHAQRQVQAMFRDLIRDAAAAGELRDDLPADELASYCLHALTAARTLPSKAAVRRLVAVTVDALSAPR